MGNQWKHKYSEKSINELHTNIYRSLEIEQYLKQILKKNSFNLYKCKLNFSNFTINIFLSIYKKKQKFFTLKKIKQIKRKSTVLEKKIKFKNQIKNFFHLKKKNLTNSLNRQKYIKILFLYKNCLLKIKNNIITKPNHLSKKILNSLNLFTHNRFNLNLTIKEINFINLNPDTKQILLNFRKFEKTLFFKEGTPLFIILITQENSAELLSSFIATQLETIKRHNLFFNFIQESLALIINQKLSKIQGIKIQIAGRLNSSARSRSKTIKIGKISLFKINSKINYCESTAFTSNGTFGVKIWVCNRKKK